VEANNEKGAGDGEKGRGKVNVKITMTELAYRHEEEKGAFSLVRHDSRYNETIQGLYGLLSAIVSSKTACSVIKIEDPRVITISLAIEGVYLGGHLEAMDILLACVG
jgi:hypothetical protein